MEEVEVQNLGPGRVNMIEPEPTSYEQYAAVLWLPDPEQRRGWREFYIRKRNGARSKPGERGWGFGNEH